MKGLKLCLDLAHLGNLKIEIVANDEMSSKRYHMKNFIE